MNPRFLPPNWSVDHQTLRTFGENSRFRDLEHEHADGPSRFRGVRRFGSRFRAFIHHDGEEEDLGVFTDEEVAARAYDTRARELFQHKAITNFC